MRKKRRIGEFRELGFELLVTLRPGYAVADDERFVDELLALVEDAGLRCGGGGAGPDLALFVTRERGSVSEDERKALRRRVKEMALVVACEVGRLVDAWHPSFGR
jgi:uncharacterized protein YggL (DUF469 family)